MPKPWQPTAFRSGPLPATACPSWRGPTRSSSAGSAAWKPCSDGSILRHSPGGRSGSRPYPTPLHRWSRPEGQRRFTIFEREGYSRTRGETFSMVLLFALLMAAQSPAAEETPSPAEAAALIASCNARKFETTIHVTVAGKPKSSLVKLCGTVGQTDAEWRRTLTDAAAKVAANPRMSPDAKQQIIAALNLEIAKLPLVTSIALPPARPAASAPTPPPVRAPLADTPEYSTLPPLPA